MSNTKALDLLANSREFDEKDHTITCLRKMLGSFILRALPMSVKSEKDGPRLGPRLTRNLPTEFGKAAIIVATQVREGKGLEVVFRFRDRSNGDPVIANTQLDLELIRYLYDNLDVFVQMAEESCQKYDGALDRFHKQMARFGM